MSMPLQVQTGPSDLRRRACYNRQPLPTQGSAMRIAIGSDHRGYHLKEQIIAMLRSKGHEVDDEGACGTESVDYPDFAALVAEEGEPRRRRARHPHLRHRHRHGDRRQQVPRRPRGPLQRRSDRRDQPPAQRSERAVPVGRHAQPADRRADGRGLGDHARSKAAGTSGGWRRSTCSKSICASNHAVIAEGVWASATIRVFRARRRCGQHRHRLSRKPALGVTLADFCPVARLFVFWDKSRPFCLGLGGGNSAIIEGRAADGRQKGVSYCPAMSRFGERG